MTGMGLAGFAEEAASAIRESFPATFSAGGLDVAIDHGPLRQIINPVARAARWRCVVSP